MVQKVAVAPAGPLNPYPVIQPAIRLGRWPLLMVLEVLYEAVVPLAPTLLLSNRGGRGGRQIIVCGVVSCCSLAGCRWSSGSTTCSDSNGTSPRKTEVVELLELLLRQVTLVPSVSLSLYPTV